MATNVVAGLSTSLSSSTADEHENSSVSVSASGEDGFSLNVSLKPARSEAEELDAHYQDLLRHYNDLHAKDNEHESCVHEWNDFIHKARDLYARKRVHVEKSISDAGVNTADLSTKALAAVHPHLDEMTVPSHDDPTAHIHNARYHAVVLKQGNSFMEHSSRLIHEPIMDPEEEANPAPPPAPKHAPPKEHESLLSRAVHALRDAFEDSVEDVADFITPKCKKVPYVPYSDQDPCWAKAALVGLFRTFTDRSKFYIAPDPNHSTQYTYPLPDPVSNLLHLHPTLRIAIAGDIGTNNAVMENLLRQIKVQNPHIIIHLGDIYVAGTSSECNDFWNKYVKVFPDEETRPPLWSIPGNHEYIDAGEGYFKELIAKKRLGDTRNIRPQESSYFCLESEKFKLQILGLDTGYNSKNFTLPLGGEEMEYSTSLHPKEANWAQQRLASAKSRGYKTILLTHHQYYSAFWKKKHTNDQLAGQIFSAGQPLTAWLWGHEHRIGVYQTNHPMVKSGQCLGHGAIPEMKGGYDASGMNSPYKFSETYIPDNVKVYQNFEPIYNGGFATLEVTDTAMTMKYYQTNRLTGEGSVKGGTITLQ